ncbi:hypothetical protein OG894_00570 [Streptomyces sp. NBC_01724]|uniref:hypothetical protein n=1 Tax=unclassified Streptomyces TaxID=2593676 RepID=UPI002E363C6F|nr:hypothetical protein [Streptomyces sp. NBC_01724]WTE56656.1 hypothetical protein OG987_42045 [Streptomyces sp. NBC_01620]WTE57394.1 hypothetical protein OG784_00545 [Streptomyces sp. NBC_01617]WTI84903.1 hypothetical protein OHB17_00880 [Streptomyces sp. NBC_00724]WTE64733.1 hypothetical protein OG784_41800 [Streptomyces sp. NBC_01617]WTI92023.1 hypothetical protein OHB17_41125 [Streptomyces sp. NBC_00724]
MNRKLNSHSFRTYAALGTAAGAAALALMVTTPAGATQANGTGSHPGTKPPVVLVHGSFADASSWNGVVKDLKRSGIAVIAPADPLRGCTATPNTSAYIPHDRTEAREQATGRRAGAASRPSVAGSGRLRPMRASEMVS